MWSLSPNACRVLGCLLEKEVTVPATYPLTLNALVSACNQTSGRDPVLQLDESAVAAAVDELREAGFARLVHASHGARTVKYRQVATDVLVLDALRRAVVTLLLLRGPQTSGELRTRSERLHPFASVDEVDRTLEHLAGLDEPLVVQQPRQPGQKESRWAHLFAGAPVEAPAAPVEAPAAPVEIPVEVASLAAFVGTWTGAGEGHYPSIADFGYTERIELHTVPGKPRLVYRSLTRAADDGRALHDESGFFRVVGDGLVELVVAQGGGVIEAADGVVDGDEIVLTSTSVVGTPTAKEVTATERRYRVVGDTLTYEIAMAAVGLPLQPHLQATLHRDA
jgi:uncharacterized protein YceH (UPF0502 family)